MYTYIVITIIIVAILYTHWSIEGTIPTKALTSGADAAGSGASGAARGAGQGPPSGSSLANASSTGGQRKITDYYQKKPDVDAPASSAGSSAGSSAASSGVKQTPWSKFTGWFSGSAAPGLKKAGGKTAKAAGNNLPLLAGIGLFGWLMLDDKAPETVAEKAMDTIWKLLEGITGMSREQVQQSVSASSCCSLFCLFAFCFIAIISQVM